MTRNRSEPLCLYGRSGDGRLHEIRTVREWFDHAPPKGGLAQWREKRSAYELANAWCKSGAAAVPPELEGMLMRCPELRGLTLSRGWIEHKTDLRGERRGPRVHDLLLLGAADIGLVVIGVEGKADEPFDRPLGHRWKIAQAALSRGERTLWPDRLRRLSPALLGEPAEVAPGVLNPEIANVPFQLLSALAGTVIEAETRGARLAVLVVHVFRSVETKDERLTRNDEAFSDFVRRLSHKTVLATRDGELYGPFGTPGEPAGSIPAGIPVVLGKLTTDS